jgi:hypothetical protein
LNILYFKELPVDIVAARTLNTLYICLDLAWLILFCSLLLYFKRRLALVVGLLAGVLYFLVDYGIFYRLLGTRVVHGADPFWFLLWLSFSYGITNFAWIWLLLDRDARAVEWSSLIVTAWLAIALLSQNFGTKFAVITIQRGTGAYHGVMAAILFAGYLYIIVQNLRGLEKINILWLMAIGIGVQFSWEAVLLVTGIRPAGFEALVVNSLIETNLGLPFIYFIHRAVAQKNKKAGIKL